MAKSNKKMSRSVKKDAKSASEVDRHGAKAAEYIDNLVELHKVQGTLLVHLQKEFVK